MSQLRYLSTAAAAAQYTVCKSVNVSASQLFKTVADVDDYDKFLPFCHHSKVTRIVESSNSTKFAFEAELTIGFPNTPFLTQYRSHVELDKAQKRCTIEAIESTAFDNLRSTWNISEGKGGNKNVCTVNFHVEYQRDGEDFALDARLPAELHVCLERITALHQGQAVKVLEATPAARKYCATSTGSIVGRARVIRSSIVLCLRVGQRRVSQHQFAMDVLDVVLLLLEVAII